MEACTSSVIGPALDWDTTPIWSIGSMYIAGLVRIKLSGGFADKKQGQLEFSPARVYLQHFESMYQIAGMLLIVFTVLIMTDLLQRFVSKALRRHWHLTMANAM
jgi:hypothetical protein